LLLDFAKCTLWSSYSGELKVYPRPFHNCSGESLSLFLKLRRKELSTGISWLLLCPLYVAVGALHVHQWQLVTLLTFIKKRFTSTAFLNLG
jgi:hypothetical protein